MKKILLVFSLIILLSSCSSDSSASDNADTVLLTKRITTWANSSVTFETNYIYEGNKMKRMTIDAQNYTLFNYTGNLISNQKIYRNQLLSVEVFYQYDDVERLTTELIIDHEGFNGEKYIYTYNQDNTVDFNFYTGSTTVQNNLSKTGVIHLNNNNDPIKVETFAQGVLKEVSEFSYGVKWNPFKNAISYRKTFIRYPSASKYNLLTSETFDENHNLLSNSSDNANYNLMNFPESTNGSNATTHFYYN